MGFLVLLPFVPTTRSDTREDISPQFLAYVSASCCRVLLEILVPLALQVLLVPASTCQPSLA